jgi:hypothetical protein
MRILKDIISVTDDVGDPGEDTTLVSEKGVRNAIDEGAGLLHNISDDKNPKLSGNLDMNGFNVGGNSEEQLDDAVDKKHTKLCNAIDFTKLNGIEEGATKTDIDSVGDFIHWADAKTTLVDADEIPFLNSAKAWIMGKCTWANIKATLKTYFDTLYSAVGAVMETDFNAKGDLLSASADDTPVILSVGVNDKVLTADSAEASGLKWADAGGGAHKDTHDPEDGADPLDTAAAAEIAGIQAAGVGTSHSLARADHAHQIQHGIADNHIVTIDHAAVADNDYAKFTANGLEGRSSAQVIGDLGGTASWELGEYSIKLDSLIGTNFKHSGITCTGIMGGTIWATQLAYLDEADQRWHRADADAEVTSGDVMLALALQSGGNGDTRPFLLQGFYRHDSWGFTSYGHALFASCTAGGITATAPSGSGDIVRVVGYVSTFAGQIYFNPSKTWLEIA